MFKLIRTTGWVAGFLALALSVPAAWADTTPQRTEEIRGIQQEIDNRASLQPDHIQKKILAERFSVSEARVQELRDKNETKGWGEIAVQLSMAKQLSTATQAAYATPDAALNEIQARRGEGKQWHDIASANSLDLSRVVEDMRSARDEFKSKGEAAASADATVTDLREAQQQIDASASKQSDQAHIDALSSQFGVTPEVVRELRREYQTKGWGEIAVQLAMAKQLSESRRTEFPDAQSALNAIKNLRSQGKDWEETARNYQLNMNQLTGTLQATVQSFRKGA